MANDGDAANIFRSLRDMFGAMDLEIGGFHLRIDGSLVVATGLTFTVYKLATQNPDVLRDIASTIVTRPQQVIAAIAESSILLDVLVQNKNAGLDLLDDLESGNMLARLRKKFDTIMIQGSKLKFDDIKLVKVTSIKNTKNFAVLKKEAEMAFNQFVKERVSQDFKDLKVVFCKVEVEKVLKKIELRPTEIASPMELSGHSKMSKEVSLNGVPESFSFSEAKRLLQELLDDEYSVTDVRYLHKMDKSTMVVQLRTPQLVEKLLVDYSAQMQVKKAFHEKMKKESPGQTIPISQQREQGLAARSSEVTRLEEKFAQSPFMMDKRKMEVYEAKIYGVPEGFDLDEAKKLLQEVVEDGSLVTDVKYFQNPDGSSKKSTIVASLTTPKRPDLDVASPGPDLQNKLWFVKSKFRKSRVQRSTLEQSRKKEMLLVKQSMERKRKLEEDVHVIDMADA